MLTYVCTLQAVKASTQGPPHVPSLDDLRVKEGQRPLTNIDSASRKLLKSLGLTADPKLKAKQQVQLGCNMQCYFATSVIPSVTHILQTQLWKSVGSLSGTSQTFFWDFCQMLL